MLPLIARWTSANDARLSSCTCCHTRWSIAFLACWSRRRAATGFVSTLFGAGWREAKAARMAGDFSRIPPPMFLRRANMALRCASEISVSQVI